jgi:hypothetical protein
MPSRYFLAATKHSVWCHKKSVLRKKRGHCAGVVLVVCLVQLPMKLTELSYCLDRPKEITLLDYWRLGRLILLTWLLTRQFWKKSTKDFSMAFLP